MNDVICNPAGVIIFMALFGISMFFLGISMAFPKNEPRRGRKIFAAFAFFLMAQTCFFYVLQYLPDFVFKGLIPYIAS
jgi:hypothetical protein